MGQPEMAEKHKNPATQVCGLRWLDPGASGDGWPENFYRHLRLDVLLLHGRRVNNSGGGNRLSLLKPDRSKNGSKRPSSGFLGFLDFLSGF